MIAAIVEQGQDVGMLKGRKLAGLVVKALQVDLAISACHAGCSSKDVQKVGSCRIRACKKDRSSPGLPHELFQAIVSHGGSYHSVKCCIFNHHLLPSFAKLLQKRTTVEFGTRRNTRENFTCQKVAPSPKTSIVSM